MKRDNDNINNMAHKEVRDRETFDRVLVNVSKVVKTVLTLGVLNVSILSPPPPPPPPAIALLSLLEEML